MCRHYRKLAHKDRAFLEKRALNTTTARNLDNRGKCLVARGHAIQQHIPFQFDSSNSLHRFPVGQIVEG